MKADKAILQLKYDSVIETLSKKKGITLREALDVFYKSAVYREMREGISDMHCRSDLYLAEEIIKDGYNTKWQETLFKNMSVEEISIKAAEYRKQEQR